MAVVAKLPLPHLRTDRIYELRTERTTREIGKSTLAIAAAQRSVERLAQKGLITRLGGADGGREGEGALIRRRTSWDDLGAPEAPNSQILAGFLSGGVPPRTPPEESSGGSQLYLHYYHY